MKKRGILVRFSIVLAALSSLAWLGYSRWGYASDGADDLIDEAPPPSPVLYKGPWEIQNPSASYQQAESEYKKQNFRRAEQAYALFIKESPRHIDVPRATFQRARALFKLSSFDEAVKLLGDFLASRPGLLFEARGRLALADLYGRMQQWGFRRGNKIYYNREHREGQQISLYYYNRKRSVRELETARLAYLVLYKSTPEKAGARPDVDLVSEAVECDLALAAALKTVGQLWDGGTPETDIAPPAPGAAYDFGWPGRSKAIFLFEEAERLAAKKRLGRLVAEARYQKAAFLMAFPESPPVSWQKATSEKQKKCAAGRENGDPLCVPEIYNPGARLDPLDIVDKLLADYPTDPKTDRAVGTRARILEGRWRFIEAEKEYRRLIDKFPKSKYTGDAKASLYDLRRAWFSQTNQTTYLPGEKKEIPIIARNVSTITFEAYRVDLEKVMLREDRLTSRSARFADFVSNFGGTKAARKWFGKKVASWKIELNDKGDHRRTQGKSAFPLDEIGAYLVLAKGGVEERVALVVVSDLMITAKQDRGKAHYWITGTDGNPLHGVALTVKEVYWMNGAEHVRVKRYRSDSDGRVTHEMIRYRYSSSSSVEAFAQCEKRYAFTGQRYCNSRGAGNDYDQSRLFTISDRPVYRPGDKVKFKVFARGYHQGKNENLPGKRVRVRLFDPRGQTLYDRTSKTDDFGGLGGEVELEKETPLGVYRLSAWVEKGYTTAQSSGSNFRVEEYKKPEFKVTVTPAMPDARPGTAVKAEIAARYYFGAPVGGGRVRYQIYRQPYWHVHYPPSRYDWLYGKGYGIVYEKPFAQGSSQELVRESEGTTDEQGLLKLELPPAEKDSKIDYLYTIQAQVTDLSRRTIQGMGEVKVTRDAFHIFTRTQQGFYSPGDRVEMEVEALTPQDKPVRADGSYTIFRLSYPVGEKEKAEKIDGGKFATDAEGRAFIGWKALVAGQYKFVLRASRDTGTQVEHEHILYVAKDDFDPGRFHFSKIKLETQKRTYLRGETIRLLLGTPHPGAVIWYSEEGGDEIFTEKVMRLTGTGTVVEIPADETRAPNFFVRVVMIENGKVQMAQREIFIPPGEEILNVSLTPDQAEKRPGSRGKFDVMVTDHQGKPVEGQFCLSVFDASVLYIQGDTTGDIRGYYYGKRRYLGLWVDDSRKVWQMLVAWEPRRPKFKRGGLPYAGSGAFYGSVYYGALGDTGMVSLPSGSAGGTIGYGRGGGGMGREFGVGDYSVSLSSRASASGPVVTGALSRGAGSIGNRFARLEFDGRDVAGQGASFSPVALREFFADTALWLPGVRTDKNGRATVKIDYPDSVTTWQGRLFVVDAGRKVGMATAQVITTKKLVARIETPRFAVEGDKIKLAAVVHNGYDHPLDVQLRIDLSGLSLDSKPELYLRIPPHSDIRHDFAASANQPGKAEVKLTARSTRESDALKKTLPVMEWGSEKMLTAADSRKTPGKLNLSLKLPAERRPGSARLTIEAAPSMAGVLLRALPYLIRYPYGCIEQTLSRFVPAAVVAHTLKSAGVSLEQLKPVRGKASIRKHLGKLPWYAAVRSSAELERIIRANLRRIASMQNPDGGFGWFGGFDSDPYMTAYAILGLHEAKIAGYSAGPDVLRRAVDCLHARIDEWRANHLGVFIAYAVGLEGRPMSKLLGRAYGRRGKLSPYGKSLLALALWDDDQKSRARRVTENLSDLAWVDEQNQTATFKPPPTRWWLWWFNRVETTGWALRAFLKVDPKNPNVDRLAKWLTLNRSGNRWYSTKDTAMAVLALTDYMRARGELNPNATISVLVNGKKVRSFRVTKKSVLGIDGTVVIPDTKLSSGDVEVEVQLAGRGVVYATAFLEFYTKEKRITGSGYEISVKRSYSRLRPVVQTRKQAGKKIKVRRYEREPLADGASVKSGELIEVRIEVGSKNDYSYLVFEDFKPAGFEPVELKSGCSYEHGAWIYRELRDQKVVHFLSSLPQGSQVLSYRLRAEIPGTFRILPHKASAMYAPRIRAISDSAGLAITD
ncbi:MAG TPA: MG2 domain-containing protein [Myxococcota bacterium]|nr:MG2 domain-containing protein [Myxococcota bacterium]